MPSSERDHELIDKYLESLASEAEVIELQERLTADANVADVFAEASRLDASLQLFFRKQYKIDQVAALLNAPDPSLAPIIAPAEGISGIPGQSAAPLSCLRASTFVPRSSRHLESRRWRFTNLPAGSLHRWKFIAAAALLLMIGIGIWSLMNAGDLRLRLISGHVAVAGRDVGEIPFNVICEVSGRDAAIMELPGKVQIELVGATRAIIRRSSTGAAIELLSGAGDFRAEQNQISLRVETVLGVVTTTGGRFSLELVTTLPDNLSPTEPIRLPRLAVVVAQGSVTVEHAGLLTTLSAGQQQVFLN